MLKRLCIFLTVLWIIFATAAFFVLFYPYYASNFILYFLATTIPIALLWGIYWVIAGNSDEASSIKGTLNSGPFQALASSNPALRTAIKNAYAEASKSDSQFSQFFDKKQRIDILNQLKADAIKIYKSNNPFLEVRSRIITRVMEMASRGVLFFSPESVRNEIKISGISGELEKHIMQLSETNDSLKNMRKRMGWNIDKDMFMAIQVIHFNSMKFRLFFYADLRNDFEKIPEEDWLPFCINIALILSEEEYRAELNLERIGQKIYGEYMLARFLSFLDAVSEGEENPLLKFHDVYHVLYKKVHNQFMPKQQ